MIKKTAECASTATPRRSTTIYNTVFLNENELLANPQQPALHTSNSTTVTATDSNLEVGNEHSLPSSVSHAQSTPQSLQECKRLLGELNRCILRPTEISEEYIIVRDWQNVALVIDRGLFYIYLLLKHY